MIDVFSEMLIEKEVITADDLEKVLGPKAGVHGEDRLRSASAPKVDDASAPESDEPEIKTDPETEDTETL